MALNIVWPFCVRMTIKTRISLRFVAIVLSLSIRNGVKGSKEPTSK